MVKKIHVVHVLFCFAVVLEVVWSKLSTSFIL